MYSNWSSSKWYVDQPHASHSTFVTLSNSFLYFQLPRRYDASTELLNSFCQTFSTHLYKSLEFNDYVYMDWILITIMAPICKYVASHFPQTKEKSL